MSGIKISNILKFSKTKFGIMTRIKKILGFTLVRTEGVGVGQSVHMVKEGDNLYSVTQGGSNSQLVIINTKTNQITRRSLGSSAYEVALSDNYILCAQYDKTDIFSKTYPYEFVRRISSFQGVVASYDNYAFLSYSTLNTGLSEYLYMYDLNTNTILELNAPTTVLNRRSVYHMEVFGDKLVLGCSGDLIIMNIHTRQVEYTYTLPFAFRQFTSDGKFLYLRFSEKDGSLTYIKKLSLKDYTFVLEESVTDLDSNDTYNQMAVDDQYLYVTNNSAPFLKILNKNTFQEVEHPLTFTYNPRTIQVDSTSVFHGYNGVYFYSKWDKIF